MLTNSQNKYFSFILPSFRHHFLLPHKTAFIAQLTYLSEAFQALLYTAHYKKYIWSYFKEKDMFTYLATVEFIEEEGAYEINFCDFPDIQGVTYCKEDVELEAEEVLLATLSDFITARKPIPLPHESHEQCKNAFAVYLPILSCLKIALHNAIIETKTLRVDLARKMNINAQQIERLLDIHYASKIEVLEQALYLLGYEAQVTIQKRTPL